MRTGGWGVRLVALRRGFVLPWNESGKSNRQRCQRQSQAGFDAHPTCRSATAALLPPFLVTASAPVWGGGQKKYI